MKNQEQNQEQNQVKPLFASSLSRSIESERVDVEAWVRDNRIATVCDSELLERAFWARIMRECYGWTHAQAVNYAARRRFPLARDVEPRQVLLVDNAVHLSASPSLRLRLSDALSTREIDRFFSWRVSAIVATRWSSRAFEEWVSAQFYGLVAGDLAVPMILTHRLEIDGPSLVIRCVGLLHSGRYMFSLESYA